MKNRKLKIGIYIVASILILLLIANIVVAYNAEGFVRKKLTEMVTGTSNGLYHLQIDGLDISILDGHLYAKGISLEIDSNRFREMKERDELPVYVGSGKIKDIRLEGVNFKFRRNFGKSLGFNHLTINEPTIDIKKSHSIQSEATADTTSIARKHGLDPYEFIAPYFEEFGIGKISLTKGNVSYQERELEGQIEGLGIEAFDFSINADRTLNNSIFFTEDIIFHTDSITVTPRNKLYTYSTGKIKIDLREGDIEVNNAGFSSHWGKFEFAHRDPKHSDWFDVRADQIGIRNLDCKRLWSERKVIADSLLIKRAILQNFKNNQIAIEHHNVPMIYTVIQDLPVGFHFECAKIIDSKVVYEELAPHKESPGRIHFTELNGTFEQYTNIVSLPKQTTRLNASGKLMGRGLIKTEMVFPVDPAYDRVDIHATMGVMEMVALNPIVEPMAPLRLDGGFIQSLDLRITGSSREATARLDLRYNDLSVELLIPTGKNHKMRGGLLSSLANGLIEKDNPKDDEAVRVVHAEYVRDPLHSSFNYLWKTILAALVKVVGYTDERQERVNRVVDVFN